MIYRELIRVPKKRRKSFYAVINQSARTDYQAARQLLETWFDDYPEQSRVFLGGKFRSSKDYNHLSAFFELYIHALLKHQRFLVHPEYIIDQSINRPIDSLVKPPDDLPFYLEAVVAMDSEAEIESEKQLKELRQSLSEINDPNFLIDFRWERKSDKQLPTAQMRLDLQKWLQKIGEDSIQEEKLEPASYDRSGWKLLFFAIPRSRPGKLKYPILGQPLSAQWAPFENSLRNKRERKGEKGLYGNLEYPFIIAVNILAQDSLGCDLDEISFGKEVYLLTGNRERGL